MGLIPHVSFYISNLLPRVLNYGWNLPDKAACYINLPPSSHLDPSGFIILCEDHLAVSKPSPDTWVMILIFIREGLFGGWRWRRRRKRRQKKRMNACEEKRKYKDLTFVSWSFLSFKCFILLEKKLIVCVFCPEANSMLGYLFIIWYPAPWV